MPLKTILIVEDDVDIRETIRFVLELEGYQVLTASNGAEGVEIIRKPERPGLILLDMNMPVMNGWEFLSVLETVDPSLPVVVLSASHYATRPKGACEVHGKPLELNRLIGIAHRYCDGESASPPVHMN